MIGVWIVFEILFFIAATIITVVVLAGLIENDCWIFDDSWWENSKKTRELEKQVSELEKQLKGMKIDD